MNEPITSRQNTRVKNAAKLRDRSGRESQRRIIIDGVREISRALDAGVELLEVFVCERRLRDDGRQLAARLSSGPVEVVAVTEPVFAKLTFGDRADGVVAVARPPQFDLASVTLKREMLVAILERLEKPGNVGAVMRSADAVGLDAVITADGGTDRYNPNAIRASAGTIFALPLIAATREEALTWLRSHDFRVLAARVDGAVDYTAASFAGRCAIVVGSEAQGLSEAWHSGDVVSVKLPMRGRGDSLNVSVTAAVLFYEALRQRQANSSRSGSP